MTHRSLTVLAPSFALLLGACGSDSPLPSSLDGSTDAGSTQPQVLPLEGVVIDDFEDGDSQTAWPGGAWFSYDDRPNGGGSSIAYTMSAPGYQSVGSLEASYRFDQGSYPYDPYVGWGVWFADAGAPFDASAYLGVAYTFKGAAHRVRVENFEIQDYDYFGMDVAASADWKTVVVPFVQLSQEGWGLKSTFNPKNVGNLAFQARGDSGTQGKVSIDNLMFLTRLPDQPPDMTVMPPAPPADAPIPSITITHPAQAKARAYLTRGYNITNWLEQYRFAGFTYDGAFVAKLAAAGFKSLRLPIDLDRYVVSTTGSGDTQQVVLHADLFTVLDAFVAWTGDVGMSLTIDFHQYDKSLDIAKPEGIATAVAVWGQVAAHFAANPRADLFYELLNEPELSMAGTPPTQAEWTAIAERMIAAIRASDTTHSILFGDINWYGIAQLTDRQPLSDGNVIYVFHDYEPFLFTHQGADWAGMASTHDLPYPYDPARWSAYFADLGFTQTMPDWILAAARGYHATGNRATLRNQIVRAKKWAVANNVPVICNEFGAYDRSSRLEDRARYLTDVVSIFEELDIPWQQWFMIMDAAGNVLPEYRAALKLGQ